MSTLMSATLSGDRQDGTVQPAPLLANGSQILKSFIPGRVARLVLSKRQGDLGDGISNDGGEDFLFYSSLIYEQSS